MIPLKFQVTDVAGKGSRSGTAGFQCMNGKKNDRKTAGFGDI